MKKTLMLSAVALLALSACVELSPEDKSSIASASASANAAREEAARAAEEARLAREDAQKAAEAARVASEKADRIFRKGQNK